MVKTLDLVFYGAIGLAAYMVIANSKQIGQFIGSGIGNLAGGITGGLLGGINAVIPSANISTQNQEVAAVMAANPQLTQENKNSLLTLKALEPFLGPLGAYSIDTAFNALKQQVPSPSPTPSPTPTIVQAVQLTTSQVLGFTPVEQRSALDLITGSGSYKAPVQPKGVGPIVVSAPTTISKKLQLQYYGKIIYPNAPDG